MGSETPIEKMLKIDFTSDPRMSRFPLKEVPPGHPMSLSYTATDVIRRAMAAWLEKTTPQAAIKARSLIMRPRHKGLSSVWNADRVRAYHNAHVS